MTTTLDNIIAELNESKTDVSNRLPHFLPLNNGGFVLQANLWLYNFDRLLKVHVRDEFLYSVLKREADVSGFTIVTYDGFVFPEKGKEVNLDYFKTQKEKNSLVIYRTLAKELMTVDQLHENLPINKAIINNNILKLTRANYIFEEEGVLKLNPRIKEAMMLKGYLDNLC
ncbi:Uncharacterised protein [Candidatus Tiddalikarchaeum anstoanum]|nr:Uncharacterised protein [Candidatus Tiddalikarchaeum anstoanum]